MTELEHLLRAVVAGPGGPDAWLAVADCLDRHGVPGRAELLRLHWLLLATCCEPERHPERQGWQARLVELLARGVRPCGPRRTVPLGGGVDMTFALVPPGAFLMGSPPGEAGRRDDEARHRVTLTAALWLGTCPVTQAQWQAVLGHNPSRFPGGGHPVERVSWHDCVAFCRKLGSKTGQPCRLPTEAEWEYACRAGTTAPYHCGDVVSAGEANCGGMHGVAGGRQGTCRDGTTPVESFLPNAWGLFDVHGNVCEWCSDRYGPCPAGDAVDPKGPNEGPGRVLRGGSWCRGPGDCRSACRCWLGPRDRRDDVGFRVVLGPE
jgi:formylglycine-generating enzyme